MADFTNKQLAEIISATSEEIKKSVLNQRKIANELSETEKSLGEKITKLESVSLEPNLKHINQFYKEKTVENIKRINSRLKVPNSAIYFWIFSAVLFFCSGMFLWFSAKSKEEIISDYRNELFKENVIIKKESDMLYRDMLDWFDKNPNTKNVFIKWRKNKK